jgi:PncC family amidohydrolase
MPSKTNISSEILRLFIDKQKSLALAESCTGGMVQQILTDIPGSSRYFKGGVVAYSNEVKVDILKVSPNTLSRFGAVSRETAREMAVGIKTGLGTDIGASVTGVAGPQGGTEDKPVGTVWFAVADESKIITEKQIFSGDRNSIREAASDYLLNLIYKSL